jgi:hypothetical protein
MRERSGKKTETTLVCTLTDFTKPSARIRGRVAWGHVGATNETHQKLFHIFQIAYLELATRSNAETFAPLRTNDTPETPLN